MSSDHDEPMEEHEDRQAGRRTGRWSYPEIDKLRRLYGHRSEAQIARELNRSLQSVRRMVGKVFDGPPRLGPWTAREVQELKSYLGATELKVIARILRRSEQEIERKIQELQGMVKQRPWTAQDTHALKRYYGTRTDADVSIILGRPIERIREKAKELCLAKDKAHQKRLGNQGKVRMPRWTQEEVAFLKEHYADQENLVLAQALNRSVKSVVSKASDLGLHKSKERLRQMGRANVKRRYQPEAGRESTASSAAPREDPPAQEMEA